MASKNMIVKMTRGTEIRRFSTASPEKLSMSQLCSRIESLFELRAKPFNITYVDDENDKITISTDDELSDAVQLALACEPSVLRLCIGNPGRRSPSPSPPRDDAEMKDASTTSEPTFDAAGSAPATAPPSLEQMFSGLASHLPGLADGLAAEAARSLPQMAAAIHSAAVNSTLRDGCHPGVTCDKSGMAPIVGIRYHLQGHDYDLCEAEYVKLSTEERAKFVPIPPPSMGPCMAAMAAARGAATPAHETVHHGVQCDRSGVEPIVGIRYHLRGRNYDLCQAEFDKLAADEQKAYEAIHSPAPHPWAGRCGWRRRAWGVPERGPKCGAWSSGRAEHDDGERAERRGELKLAARFVRDVSVFDGTQIEPSTPFTKIWRLKNIGDVPWPQGARLLFVGGDQMSAELSVPVLAEGCVMPGVEVDVAVNMIAPREPGRFLGYWRLTGPYMRRKFGQRVWCHVHVIDPSRGHEMANEVAHAEALSAELESKKNALAASDPDDVDDGSNANESVSADAAPVGVSAEVASTGDMESDDGFVMAECDESPQAQTQRSDQKARTSSDAHGATAAASADDVKAKLRSMGFIDEGLLETVLVKHGAELEPCARDLSASLEWDAMLDDLSEMGFEDRERNKRVMLKHDGNIKRAVRELVEA